MSDEFFFDDDAVEEKAAKKKAAPKKGQSKASSGKKNETSNKSNKTDSKAQPKVVKKDKAPQEEAIAASWTLTLMIAVIALLIGAIGGIFIGKSIAPKVVYDSSSINTSNGMESMMGGSMGGATTDGAAPEGEMPANHPDISTMGGSGSDAGTSGK